jgi:hypothetical protein
MKAGVAELLADIEFCRTHQCRPSKFAEHASTAADFFYKTQSFDEAEKTLDAAIQVRSGPSLLCLVGAGRVGGICWACFRSGSQQADILRTCCLLPPLVQWLKGFYATLIAWEPPTSAGAGSWMS